MLLCHSRISSLRLDPGGFPLGDAGSWQLSKSAFKSIREDNPWGESSVNRRRRQTSLSIHFPPHFCHVIASLVRSLLCSYILRHMATICFLHHSPRDGLSKQDIKSKEKNKNVHSWRDIRLFNAAPNKRSPRCIFFHITKQTLTGMVCLFLSRVCIICNPQLFSHLCCFLFIFSSLPPSTFTAPGSVGGSASLQRGRSAELQITLCSPKHQQAFPEPLRSPSTDRFGPFSVL